METLSDAYNWTVTFYSQNEIHFQIVVFLATVLLFPVRIFQALRWMFLRVWRFFDARKHLERISASIARIKSSGRWSEPVLSAERELQLRQRRSIPILLVANLKGGVGKTTLAANLGAYFAARRQKRVLFIDLDFQGTLSSSLNNVIKATRIPRSGRVSSLLRDPFPDKRAVEFFESRSRLAGVKVATNEPGVRESLYSSAFFPTDDELADLEDWLMLQWSTLRAKDDVRFRLLRFLLSDIVQKEFDIVVLDAPPRDTTAGVNGICAATHLVVPTKSDAFSTAGALPFLERVAEFHDRLAPNAAMLGFVTTMTEASASEPRELTDAESALIESVATTPVGIRGARARRPISGYFPSSSCFDFLGALYQRKAFQDDAGASISYLTDSGIRGIVDTIGDEIWRRMEALNLQHGERKDQS